MTAIPELEPHCGSWICTQNDTDAVHAVRERMAASAQNGAAANRLFMAMTANH
jgi:hypothetical protein